LNIATVLQLPTDAPYSPSLFDYGRAAPHRAEASQKNGGVLPDAVMIANGWLSVPDY
jgi:hypothetical protein